MNKINIFSNRVQEAIDYIGSVDNIRLEVQTIYDIYAEAKKILDDNPHFNLSLTPFLLQCKNALPPRYIIQFNPKFSDTDHLKFIKRNYFDTDEEYLDAVVLATRKHIFDHSSMHNELYMFERFNNMEGFKSINMSDRCYTYSKVCNAFFRKSGLHDLTSTIREIKSGFSRKYVLDNYLCNHYYVEVTFNGKSYIVDPTYSQFFILSENILETLGICNYDLPLPGIYMIQNKLRLNVARTLLERGWIEATEENVKAYFDGFALSFRNGYYYEQIGNSNFVTKYTSGDYSEFLFGDVSQLDIEGMTSLGYQLLPLKDLTFDFTSNKVLYESKNKKLVKRCQI